MTPEARIAAGVQLLGWLPRRVRQKGRTLRWGQPPACAACAAC